MSDHKKTKIVVCFQFSGIIRSSYLNFPQSRVEVHLGCITAFCFYSSWPNCCNWIITRLSCIFVYSRAHLVFPASLLTSSAHTLSDFTAANYTSRRGVKPGCILSSLLPLDPWPLPPHFYRTTPPPIIYPPPPNTQNLSINNWSLKRWSTISLTFHTPLPLHAPLLPLCECFCLCECVKLCLCVCVCFCLWECVKLCVCVCAPMALCLTVCAPVRVPVLL